MRCFQCDNYSLPCTCGKIKTMAARFSVVYGKGLREKYYVIDSGKGIGLLEPIPLTDKELAYQVCNNLNEQVEDKNEQL
jgi:hypothetical protein